MKTIAITEQHARFLEEIITNAVELDARLLSKLDPVTSPQMYKDTSRDLRLGCELLGVVGATGATVVRLSSVANEVETVADLSDIPEEVRDLLTPAQHARARDPRCVHNRKASEPCDECAKGGGNPFDKGGPADLLNPESKQ